MLAVANKNHSPQQIYDHFFKAVGQLRVKLWRKFIILEFEDPKNINVAYKKFKTYQLNSKRLQLKMLKQNGEINDQYQLQIQKQKTNAMDIQVSNNNENISKHIQIIYEHKQLITDHINTIIKKFVKQINEKTKDIQQSYPDQQPRNRELNTFQTVLKNKLKHIRTNFFNEQKRAISFIKNFSVINPQIIDIDPNFQQKNFKHKSIDINNISIEQGIEFINNKSSIKRMFPLNQKQFVLTQRNQSLGQVKFYSLNAQQCKKNINCSPLPYGITCFSDYLFVGNSNGQVEALSLKEDKTLDSKPHDVHKSNTIILDIKMIKQRSQNLGRIVTLSNDNNIKINSVIEQQISNNLYALQFKLVKSIRAQETIFAFQIWNQSKYYYNQQNKIIMEDFLAQSKGDSKRTIFASDPIMRLKKFNENILAASMNKSIYLFDIRTQKECRSFQNLVDNIRPIEVCSNNSIFYGGANTIGLVDDRRPEKILWQNSTAHSKSKVYDIITLQNSIISGDDRGRIFSWNF